MRMKKKVRKSIMMNFTEFKEYVAANINEIVEDSVKGEPVIAAVRKVNETYTGLTLNRRDDGALPTANLEMFYRSYRDIGLEKTMQQIAECLSMQMPQHLPFNEVTKDWEKAKEHVSCRAVGFKGNEELAEDGPTDLIEGILLLYYLNLDAEDGGVFSARITYDLLESLNIDEKRLKEEAMQLAMEHYPPQILHFSPEMTLVTSACQGAAALFYPGVFEQLAKEIGGSCYLIPSSIHEWIAVPEGVAEPENLLVLLRETNRTVVEAKDKLSDDLYRYDAQEKRFSKVVFGEEIAAAGRFYKGGELYA